MLLKCTCNTLEWAMLVFVPEIEAIEQRVKLYPCFIVRCKTSCWINFLFEFFSSQHAFFLHNTSCKLSSTSKHRTEKGDWARTHYLETDLDPSAMAITVEFIHPQAQRDKYKLALHGYSCTDYVTGVFCLQGLWMNSSTLITMMAIGSGPVSR